MRRENEFVKIDAVKIARGLVRRLWVIVISMVLCGCIMLSLAAFVIAPKYESSILMYVNNSSFSSSSSSYSFSSSEISAAKSLVDTYLVILNTRSTLNDVIEQGGLSYSYTDLQEMISAESVNGTEVFSVKVTSRDPAEAGHIANTIAQVLPGKIAGIVDGSSVSIVDYAMVPTEKVSPVLSVYAVVGLLGGLLISCAVIAVIEILDDQIHSENYLLENFGEIPLLTIVPDLLGEKRHSGYYYYGHPETDSAGKHGKRSEKE